MQRLSPQKEVISIPNTPWGLLYQVPLFSLHRHQRTLYKYQALGISSPKFGTKKKLLRHRHHRPSAPPKCLENVCFLEYDLPYYLLCTLFWKIQGPFPGKRKNSSLPFHKVPIHCLLSHRLSVGRWGAAPSFGEKQGLLLVAILGKQMKCWTYGAHPNAKFGKLIPKLSTGRRY